MARPRKPDEEIKTVRVTFRMTPKQAANFQKFANDTGMKRSELARYIARGMKQVYISDELIEEVRDQSRQIARIGNLLRLHATLLEVIDRNPSLTDSDREELVRLHELLGLSSAGIRDLKKSAGKLRKEVQQLLHGNL